MTTNSYDTALDFLPEAKTVETGPRGMALLKAIFEAFAEARTAESRYRDLLARGVSHEQAAREVFNVTFRA